MAQEMPKTYEPGSTEERMLDKWLEGGYYQRSEGQPGKGDRTVVIPPPNVTGMLHMGHALDDTIQDTYIRYSRMRGYSTRWIVGTDHAGIATQTKVDKKLKEQGIDRRAIGRVVKDREEFADWVQARRASQHTTFLEDLFYYSEVYKAYAILYKKKDIE